MICLDGIVYEVFEADHGLDQPGPADDTRSICDRAIRQHNQCYGICRLQDGRWQQIHCGQLFEAAGLEPLDVFWGVAWKAPWGAVYALKEVSYQGAMEEFVFASWEDFKKAALGMSDD